MKVKIFKLNSLKFWWFRVKNDCERCEHNRFVEICYICNNRCIKKEK